MPDNILFEVKSSAPSLLIPNHSYGLITKSVLRVREDGVNITQEGVATLFSNQNTSIPFENITSIEIEKKIMGLYYSLEIRETSGRKHEIPYLTENDAFKTRKFILEFKDDINKKKEKQSASPKLDYTQQLLNLAQLQKDGIITQEEFEKQKLKILGSV
jgi:hypothetical protein